MNTMADIFEWVLHTGESQQDNIARALKDREVVADGGCVAEVSSAVPSTLVCHPCNKHMSLSLLSGIGPKESLPSLSHIGSESSLLDDSLSSTDSDMDLSSRSIKRRVVFHTMVEVREYSLAVGDHPMCNGPLSLTLDWQHADVFYKDLESSQHRGMFYRAPYRLSLRERKQRLVVVAGYKDAELDALIVPQPVTIGDDLKSLVSLLTWSFSHFSLRSEEGDTEENSSSNELDEPFEFDVTPPEGIRKEPIVTDLPLSTREVRCMPPRSAPRRSHSFSI